MTTISIQLHQLTTSESLYRTFKSDVDGDRVVQIMYHATYLHVVHTYILLLMRNVILETIHSN